MPIFILINAPSSQQVFFFYLLVHVSLSQALWAMLCYVLIQTVHLSKSNLVTRTPSPGDVMIRHRCSALCPSPLDLLRHWNIRVPLTGQYQVFLYAVIKNSWDRTWNRANFTVYKLYLKIITNNWRESLLIASWYLDQVKLYIYQKGLSFIVNFSPPVLLLLSTCTHACARRHAHTHT